MNTYMNICIYLARGICVPVFPSCLIKWNGKLPAVCSGRKVAISAIDLYKCLMIGPRVKCIDWDKFMLSPGLWGEKGMSGSLGWGSLYRQSIDLSLISGHECGKHLCLSETFQLRVNFYGCREAEHDRCRSSNGSDIDRRLSRLFCQSDRIVDLDRIAMPRSEAVCAYKEWNENGIKGLFLVFFS